ncbi:MULTISPECIES: UDP-N-acetylmuramoylalanyl-D-glutamyl-2,6-diaminopimelate--D-alanyl-D-alanine ligase [Methylobacterium]|jgi:UDP-N-acetylmuramoyl-tripeptide--D-alanyl-D-alanine ligase|uniref:UDP-N-acetylmuramoylalanyl-D-glutamyl-2, 6-diaminopimelate--D-alanyl-D-alanine ligase n=3 Tax=Methylobacteriaceae TaxID=119045 RepID=UPI0008EA357C|nr:MULTISPECIES: UDP-N-acetylmuramoylalanyl-D-glutamyl-2,6-diaminopimelate--D-alanyl-D-alanine ligase [Methylobacterium]MBK3395798.1 UDP-N-acetylmuramoylalanyl-D-glutamyl-2,6-diaminopimelate--D-alanyl-D-alanine ligase [Methylobacterium ajmalii]MBZ6412121.1 UDP-N-acetylmuramoylalanyl-D-glutamyl-2,6-diaminopimelate--D-alanyl-D-alanine ligase [Methylobacterium sp.]SFF11469.1 UDP-N-acetylmuramoyl-tripeptide--D-alanyl-D-alanine ligase [Methylobacterium sp. yr596]
MTEPLWTLDTAAAAMGGRAVADAAASRDLSGISIDTRTLKVGDLFFAIRGEARDGHDFVRDALARGAGAAVVAEERAADLAEAGPVIAVPARDEDGVLAAMRGLAAAARARTGARVLAVTGSVGKTGTKEALRHVLAAQGVTHASVASYNNHWGVPLTLSRMPAASEFGVFEVGMNHAGEIAPLTRLVRPEIAIVTTVEPVHIEHFRSLSGIADAKGEIFYGLEPGGVAIVNRDNPNFERLKAHALASRAGRIVSFGEHREADVRAERIVMRPDLSIVDVRAMGQAVTYQLGTPGRHTALNSLAVIAAVQALGADLALAALSLAQLRPPVGRGARTMLRIGDGEALLVDESYNANPASIRAALSTLAGAETAGRRIAILGDMMELGADAPALHRELAGAVEEHGIDLVLTAGPLMQELFEALPASRRAAARPTSAELVDPVLDLVRPGDAVMVKGSNSTRMGRIVEALKARYGAQDQDLAVGRSG